MGVMGQTAAALGIIVAGTFVAPPLVEFVEGAVGLTGETVAAANLHGAEVTLLFEEVTSGNLRANLAATEPGVHWVEGPVVSIPAISVASYGDSFGLATRFRDTCLYRVVIPNEMRIRSGRAELAAAAPCQAVDAFARAF